MILRTSVLGFKFTKCFDLQRFVFLIVVKPMLLNKYSDLGGGEKKFDSEFLSYNLMLNTGQEQYIF
jgi:hypothetical protein